MQIYCTGKKENRIRLRFVRVCVHLREGPLNTYFDAYIIIVKTMQCLYFSCEQRNRNEGKWC